MTDANPRLHSPGSSERDFPEDFRMENGNYVNKCCLCKEYFWGYKRRVVCKVCDAKPEEPERTCQKCYAVSGDGWAQCGDSCPIPGSPYYAPSWTPFKETMWSTMSPDVYAGENCDGVEPRWKCSSVDDMGDSDFSPELKLAARTFPPGTKIVIEEPLCPNCRSFRNPTFVDGRQTGFESTCGCGFDWDKWVLDVYS